VIDQVAQRVFESAGDELLLQVNGQEAWAGKRGGISFSLMASV